MRSGFLILAFAALAAPVAAAAADQPAQATAQQAPRYSTTATPLGVLFADPAAKAIIARHVPQLAQSSDIAERASGMTLKELQESLRPWSPDLLSDAVLARIEADFAAMPAAN